MVDIAAAKQKLRCEKKSERNAISLPQFVMLLVMIKVKEKLKKGITILEKILLISYLYLQKMKNIYKSYFKKWIKY